MQDRPMTLLASVEAGDGRVGDGWIRPRAPGAGLRAKLLRFLAAPKPPGRTSASKSAGSRSATFFTGAAGDARGLGHDPAGFALGDLAGLVVDHVVLGNVGGGDGHRGPGPVEGGEGEHGLVDLGAIKDAAAGENHRNLLHAGRLHGDASGREGRTPRGRSRGDDMVGCRTAVSVILRAFAAALDGVGVGTWPRQLSTPRNCGALPPS